MILLTYAFMTYIRKPFKETFFIKKNEKVINFVIIFSNPHKTVLKNKWLMHAFLRIYLWIAIFPKNINYLIIKKKLPAYFVKCPRCKPESNPGWTARNSALRCLV